MLFWNCAAPSATRQHRCRSKREQLEKANRLLPESQGQILALTVSHVPYSLDNGRDEDASVQTSGRDTDEMRTISVAGLDQYSRLPVNL